MTKTTLKTKLFSLIIVLTMLVSILPLSEIVAYAVGEGYEEIALDEEKTVTLDGETVIEKIFAFTPAESGKYTFYSYDGDHDTYGYILDENEVELKHNDDYGDTNQFCVHYEMTEGTTYLLKACFYNTDNSGSMKVKVLKTPDVSSISFEIDVYTYGVGDVVDMSYDYTVEPFLSDRSDLVWESSDESVAIVYDEKVLFLAPGTTTVTLSNGADISDSLTLTVLAANDMELDTEYTVDHSVLDTVTYKFVPEEDGEYGFYAYDISGERVSLSVRNSDLGYVTDTGGHGEIGGYADLHGGETYYIALDCEIGTASYKTKVMKLVDATTMSLNYTTYDGYVDDCVQLEAKFLMGEMRESVSWISSDEAVAAVNDSGYVYFLAAGNATITATSTSGFTASCEITVTVHTHEAQGWDQSEDYHYGYCECGEYIEEQHEFDSNNVCVDCGYEYCEHVFDVFNYDAANHWIECSLCGDIDYAEGYTGHEYNELGLCECGRQLLVGGIYLGAQLLSDGEYLDNDGNVTTTVPEGGYAHYDDGVLTLNDFELVNQEENGVYGSSAIYSETDLSIVLVGDNYLEAAGDDAIYVAMADLTVSGGGTLKLLSREVYDENYNSYTADCIDTDGGSLTINGGTIIANGSDHGFEVSNNLTINGGNIWIEAEDEGMQVDSDVLITGGNLYIEADDYGIECDGYVTIDGGYIYIYADDYEGIKADYDFTMNGGALVIETEDDHGITSYGNVYLNGGQLKITLEDTGYCAIVAALDIILSEDMNDYGVTDIVHDDIDCLAIALDGEALTEMQVNIDGESEKSIINETCVSAEYDEDGNLVISVRDSESGEELTRDVDYAVLGESTDNVKLIIGIGDYEGIVLVKYTTIISVTPGSTTTVTAPYTDSDSKLYLKFTPTVSGSYIIYSESDYDPCIEVCDSAYNRIGEADDENDYNFYLEIYLEAGETYYFDIADYDGTNKCIVYLTADCDEHVGGEATYTEQAVCGMCGTPYGDILECDHMCHKGGIYRYIWKAFERIYDFFGIETECKCGEKH
ncbi:MAG: carbohydrate-binding domain-containing protein [Clostridia bacterium]|nr:carbohydrate-binding domain-containing protein [Clostridia bacterium]